MMTSLANLLITLIVLGFTCASMARAQSVSIYSSIVGTVTDRSGAPVSGAAVSATNAATNITTDATTDSEGLYRIERIIQGTYSVTAAKTGFD